MLATNYTGVKVIISELDDQGSYDFTVHNDGDLVLWGLQFPTYDLLDPISFGLDDTHMPSSLTDEPNAQIDRLSPNESVFIHRKKWGTLESYRGHASGYFYATFSPLEDGSIRYGLHAVFSILKQDGTAFVAAPPKRKPSHSPSYESGYAAGQWLKRMLKKLGL